MWPFRRASEPPEPIKWRYEPTNYLRLVGVNKLQQLWRRQPAINGAWMNYSTLMKPEDYILRGEGEWRDVPRIQG